MPGFKLMTFASNVTTFGSVNTTPVVLDHSQSNNTISFHTPSFMQHEPTTCIEDFSNAIYKKIRYTPKHPIDYYTPLFRALSYVIEEPNQQIKAAMRKKQGYFSRLFSNESWENWLEDKTEFGKVVFAFMDYLENPSMLTEKFIKRLTLETIEKANTQATYVLEEIPEQEEIAHTEEEISLWGKIKKAVFYFDKKLFFPYVVSAKAAIIVAENNAIDLYSPPEKPEETLRKYGFMVPIVESTCSVAESFHVITSIKEINPDKEADLNKAYRNLLISAKEDDLQQCYGDLQDFLATLQLHSQSYPSRSLHQLPDLLLCILHKTTVFTIKDLNFLISKINLFAQTMLVNLKGKNEQKPCSRWVDVLLQSTDMDASSTGSMKSTFELALKFVDNDFTQEQKKKLRRLAKPHVREDNVGSQEYNGAKAILEKTGPQLNLIRSVYDYSEQTLDDCEQLFGLFRERTSPVFENPWFQGSVVLISFLVMFYKLSRLSPSPWKGAALLLTGLYASALSAYLYSRHNNLFPSERLEEESSLVCCRP